MSRAEERRKGRDSGSDMKKFYMVLGAVGILGVAAVGYSVGANAFGTAAAEPVEVEGLDDQATLIEKAQGVTKGDPEAPVTIVEFGDFQCPGCAQFALSHKPQVDLLLVESGKAKFVFYDYPLTEIHQHAFLAARAARCAQDQEMYWEYHDVLFRNQPSWSSEQSPIGSFVDYAEEVGLDGNTFEGCLKSDRHADVVSANMRLGYELGVNSTPTIMVQGNGRLQRLASYDFRSIQNLVESLVAPAADTTGN